MEQERLELGKRDWSIAVPWIGKPVEKRYYDWAYCGWRTEVCILLGVRQGKMVQSRKQKFAPPDEAPPTPNNRERNIGIRVRLRAWLGAHPNATFVDICAALPDCKPPSLRAMLHNDPQIQYSGAKGKGQSKRSGQISRWCLRPEAVSHAK